jgi:hypothetical protein
MSGTLSVPVYPVDYTGTNPANKITNEIQALTGGAGQSFYIAIPKLAPFFDESLVVSFKAVSGETRTLVKGIDYYSSHYFISASRACGKEIYGSISFNDLTLNGSITFTYQTLGGIWTQDATAIALILADRLRNPLTTVWEQVVDMPAMFPVVDHEWNLTDMVGMSQLVDAVNSVTDAVLASATSVSNAHINNVNNPHQVTAAQIGAVTQAQLVQAVRDQVSVSTNTDLITEGQTNLFFKGSRVLAAPLTGVDFSSAQNRPIAVTDNVGVALKTLQQQINASVTAIAGKVDRSDPEVDGVGSQKLVTIEATTSTTIIDLSQAAVFKINLHASTQLVFAISNLPDTTNRVVEFALTIVNGTGGPYAVSFPSNVKWPFGVIPSRTSADGASNSFYFFSEDNKASWTGNLSSEDPR